MYLIFDKLTIYRSHNHTPSAALLDNFQKLVGVGCCYVY